MLQVKLQFKEYLMLENTKEMCSALIVLNTQEIKV